MELSLHKNEGIRRFFEGDDSYIPTSEMYYLSTRPLVSNTFLHEIQSLIPGLVSDLKNQSEEVLKQRVGRLESLVIEMDKEITKTWKSPEETKPYLLVLREVFTLCKKGF